MKRYIFSILFVCSYLSAEIRESHNICDILTLADKDTLVVTDLNNVLMVTTKPLGSDTWAAYEVKQRMAKTGMTKLEVLHHLVPLWHHILMESKFRAVEPETAGVIRQLQQQGNIVIGLTARYIEMAYSTINQLHSICIDLSLNTLSDFNHEIEGGFSAKYLEGIVFVGLKNDKGETLMRWLNHLDYQPKKILFIDDKEKNLRSVSIACEKRGIPFLGLWYRYLDSSRKTFDPVAGNAELKAFLKKRECERVCRVTEADQQASQLINRLDLIEMYFNNFQLLASSEKWEEILSQGQEALKHAKRSGRVWDEAKICAQLTSTTFYLGDYSQSLVYANRCHQLSEAFEDPSLFIRALYLESAVHRAFAGKKIEETAKQAFYYRAVEVAKEASCIYSNKKVDNTYLKGKIYFNLGAAHADNPTGDLEEAARCYSIAIECFKDVKAIEDLVRINIRLGKVYLIQRKYDDVLRIINAVRLQISNDRLAMHADYLEAQLKLETNDIAGAVKVAQKGLLRANTLGAKEDKQRLVSLLQKIEDNK